MRPNFIQDPRTKAFEINLFKESVQNSQESKTNAALNSACLQTFHFLGSGQF